MLQSCGLQECSCYTALVSKLELMNKCIAHTAVSTMNGDLEGEPGTEWQPSTTERADTVSEGEGSGGGYTVQ